ncbi:MAG: hypothetical protein IKT48_03185 [Anaerotignum sp.]|nr:hypothetical protein [Anaerotignum sp.]MBR5794028.1 hypothetical protein [Anaerotignum sp.]
MRKKLLTYFLLAVMALSMSACGNTAENGVQPVEKAGTVILSVNPSVMIDYDTNGLVMDISGLNEDGLNLAAQEEDLIGIPCLVALHKLIVDIHDAGFFVSDFGGKGRDIFLYLQKGSIYHEGFLKALEQSISEAAEECGLTTSHLITINANEENTALQEDLEVGHLYLDQLDK